MERRSDGRERAVDGETDWAQVAAKTDEEVARAAESDPDAQPLTSEDLARARRIPDHVDVREIRRKRRLSQAAFAQRYGFELALLQDWEKRRQPPDLYARILLAIIEKDPDAVERALAVAVTQ
jgi:putative transcriptional regulator